jgi:hypothetical protein
VKLAFGPLASVKLHIQALLKIAVDYSGNTQASDCSGLLGDFLFDGRDYEYLTFVAFSAFVYG